ncbi:hypothetical protein HZA56_14095 [Candidatus Poribacteria bacterium]|nr:hypothetical protein [Candidatus Poribacteria bacterium]
MQNGLIEPNGDPSPEFQDAVYQTVEDWIKRDDELGNRTQFIVVGIVEGDGRKSYWGVIDVPNTPREDLYITVMKRVYAGWRSTDHPTGWGILDWRVVVDRVEIQFPTMS